MIDSPRTIVILADGPAQCLNLVVAFALPEPPPCIVCEIPVDQPCRCGDPHCDGGSSRKAVALYSRGIGGDGVPMIKDGMAAYFFDSFRK